jgi:hypothetical protein
MVFKSSTLWRTIPLSMLSFPESQSTSDDFSAKHSLISGRRFQPRLVLGSAKMGQSQIGADEMITEGKVDCAALFRRLPFARQIQKSNSVT